MALLNEHLMTFNQYKDAKTLFAAIQTRFGSNEATKKTQKSLLKQMYENFSSLSTNLPSEWNAHVVVWRNKPDLDTMSIDDLYNNFKIVEQEVKETASSSSWNMAFVSSPSSTNKVNTAYGVSTANTQVTPASTQVSTASTQVSTTNLSDATVECIQPRNQDSKNRNQDSSRRTVNVEDTSSDAMVAIDGADSNWSYMADDEVLTNIALMAFLDSEEFQQLEFEGYRPKTSKSANEDISNEAKESLNAPLVKELVSDDKPKAVNTARPKAVNTARPSSVVVNPVRVNQIQVSNGLGPQRKLISLFYVHGYPQKVQEDQGYVDSGCSRHMTGNMSYLSDFKEFNGGYVTFRGGANGGRITGKGTIKTGNLDFEDVYFVKELKFNLFSVSQMCDRKNNILFTDTECLVLSPNFKLPNESQILLRVPRRNNMYSIYMKNIVPKESLACLVAKATLDESMLWHRRLGHINFKNTNKLVKDTLVRALPSKCFKNDQTCVACLKGKQHKASSNKDETTGILKKFITEIENLVDKKVKNRVLVVKSHNKTPYELFRGRTPALSFMGPFGCHVTILNTLDPLGKFDGKSNEGFFVGYSLNSNVFRVYNIRTRKVEENLHIRFLEDKPSIAGNGPMWMFDIDVLTKSINYLPVVVGTNSNDFVGIEESIGEGHSSKEKGTSQDYILMPLWKDGSLFDSSSKNASNVEPQPSSDAGKKDDEGTRRMTKTTNEQGFISVVYEGKSHEDLNTCLFACFLSKIEPIRISKALYDLAWGKKAIGTKWVFRNKKDEIGIVIKNKARIEEEVYVCQPLGFEDPGHLDKVYKVVKALYDFHQAPRAYVKFASTLVDTEKTLVKDVDGDDVDVHLYRSMIGSLMYLTTSRPDIMYAVCVCAKFQVTPKVSHVHAVKRIFRYLKGHPKLGLWYLRDSPFELVAYTDSDYAGASLDRMSTTGTYSNFSQSPMANLEFCNTHNLVAYLQKPKGSKGFHQIMDILNTSHISTLDNGEMEITATIDGKVKVVTEAFVRRHLKLDNSDGISNLPTAKFFKQLALMGSSIKQETEIPQPSSSPYTNVADEAASTGEFNLDFDASKEVFTVEKEVSNAEPVSTAGAAVTTASVDQLRGYSFDELKTLFETIMKRVNTFVPIESEVDRAVLEFAAGSSKRGAEEELDQRSSKRQNTGESS
nr:ribonuclease H-like domain-containing protein [Tanacetum cinerariifolium]